jgi:hypothetical protein
MKEKTADYRGLAEANCVCAGGPSSAFRVMSRTKATQPVKRVKFLEVVFDKLEPQFRNERSTPNHVQFPIPLTVVFDGTPCPGGNGCSR